MQIAAAFLALSLACATPTSPMSEPHTRTAVPDLCVRYAADRETLGHFHDLSGTPERAIAFASLEAEYDSALDALDFDALDVEARVDWICLRRRIESDRRRLAFEESRLREIDGLVPFGSRIRALHAAMRAQSPSEPGVGSAAASATSRSRGRSLAG